MRLNFRVSNLMARPTMWRCQNEVRDSCKVRFCLIVTLVKELLIQSFLNPSNSNQNTMQREREKDILARQGTLMSQNGSELISAQQSASMVQHHKQPLIQYVECISKSYRFLCTKCGKKFKKLITSDLQNQAAIDNLEDTLNQPQSKI